MADARHFNFLFPSTSHRFPTHRHLHRFASFQMDRQKMNLILPKAESQAEFTLPLGGSRGTSGEGMIHQLNPSRTLSPKLSDPAAPSRFVVPPQRCSLREGKKQNSPPPSGRVANRIHPPLARGTSGEGLIHQLNPSRTLPPKLSDPAAPSRFVVPPQRCSLREGKKQISPSPSSRVAGERGTDRWHRAAC